MFSFRNLILQKMENCLAAIAVEILSLRIDCFVPRNDVRPRNDRLKRKAGIAIADKSQAVRF